MSSLRYILLEADTRVMEGYLSLISFAWGIWLILDPRTAIGGFLGHDAGLQSDWPWAIASVLGGMFQGWALYYRWPRLRTWSAIYQSFYWFMVLWTLWNINSSLWVSCTSLIFLLGQLGVLLHRTSLGKL
jgi:hypothetical protein